MTKKSNSKKPIRITIHCEFDTPRLEAPTKVMLEELSYLIANRIGEEYSNVIYSHLKKKIQKEFDGNFNVNCRVEKEEWLRTILGL